MGTQVTLAAAIDAAVDFTGGTCAGIASVLVGQPLDTIKVKLQTYPQLYRGTYHCIVKTFRTEGVTKGLYRGTVPNLVANVAENSVLFCAYGVCQSTVAKVIGQEVSSLRTVHNATAGCGAAFFASLALCPTELVKCRLQTLAETGPSGTNTSVQRSITPLQLTKQILRLEGIRGLYHGLVSTWVREMPGYFVFFGAYEHTRTLMAQPGQSKDDIGNLKTAAAGGVGGCCFWTTVFPADVVKSRIQVMSTPTMRFTFMSVLKHIVATEGLRGLYSGLLATLIRTVPATGALFVTYEWTKRVLGGLLRPDTDNY